MLVNDDKHYRSEIANFLRNSGHRIIEKGDANEALTAFQSVDIHLVLADDRMPNMSGIEFLRKIKSMPRGQDADIVVVIAYGNMQTAIETIRAGAYDYLLKPLNIDELIAVIKRVAEHLALKRENKVLKLRFAEAVANATQQTRQELLSLRKAYIEAIGLKNMGFYSAVMKRILKMAEQFHADVSLPVLIDGETGTGKDVIARIIHYGQGDVSTPFIAFNCAAAKLSMLEEELFGCEESIFTAAAVSGQKGKLDLARGGTLFLDKITEMPYALQSQLVRVIQEKEYFRVGGVKARSADLRIIGATRRNLEKEVAQGRFSYDLFCILNKGRIHLPPLRERTEDILPLTTLFLSEFAAETGKGFETISQEAADTILSHDWPGNIKELRNAVQRIVLTADDIMLKPDHLDFLNPNNSLTD